MRACTNPKALVFDAAAGSATGQMLVLGLRFALIACTLDGTWGLLAGVTRNWAVRTDARSSTLRRPAARRRAT